MWSSSAAGALGHVWGATVLTAEELGQRRSEIEAAPELSALLQRLVARAAPVLERMPPVPQFKALLTADGGYCPDDGTRLERAVIDAGALGGKAAGSGAGGCMFFLGPDEPAPMIEAARDCGVRILPVRWAMYGVRPC